MDDQSSVACHAVREKPSHRLRDSLIPSICPAAPNAFRRAFTFIELIAVIAIIGILAAIIIPSYTQILRAAGKVGCVNNMRQLHVAFASYMHDNGYWPQQPAIGSSQGDVYEAWWITVMYPYARDKDVWICPVLKGLHLKNSSGNPELMNYTPSMFDLHPLSPYRWATQPWLVENANAHGHGPLILMPDGSITSLGAIFPGMYHN